MNTNAVSTGSSSSTAAASIAGKTARTGRGSFLSSLFQLIRHPAGEAAPRRTVHPREQAAQKSARKKDDPKSPASAALPLAAPAAAVSVVRAAPAAARTAAPTAVRTAATPAAPVAAPIAAPANSAAVGAKPKPSASALPSAPVADAAARAAAAPKPAVGETVRPAPETKHSVVSNRSVAAPETDAFKLVAGRWSGAPATPSPATAGTRAAPPANSAVLAAAAAKTEHTPPPASRASTAPNKPAAEFLVPASPADASPARTEVGSRLRRILEPSARTEREAAASDSARDTLPRTVATPARRAAEPAPKAPRAAAEPPAPTAADAAPASGPAAQASARAAAATQAAHAPNPALHAEWLQALSAGLEQLPGDRGGDVELTYRSPVLGELNIALRETGGRLEITVRAESDAMPLLRAQERQALERELTTLGYDSVSLSFNAGRQHREQNNGAGSHAENADNVKLAGGKAAEADLAQIAGR